MEIRAITVGTNVAAEKPTLPAEVGRVVEEGGYRFAQAGLTVQSFRLASQPFPEIVPPERGAVVGFARDFERHCREHGISFTGIGPAGPLRLEYAPLLLDALLATEQVFGSVSLLQDGQPSLAAVEASAAIIKTLAERTEEGMGNLRFAALAGVPPLTPFFPAAYHDGGPSAFSIAWEAADLAVAAFTAAGSLEDARQRLFELVHREARHVAALVALIAERCELIFAGLDLSLAPFPETSRSIGEAFERLGVDVFGAPGTLFVAALITGVLREIDVPKAGYCGLMLPVLEDPVLAERGAEGDYSLNDLLLYSAVCGTGLDVAPLPGDTSREALQGILLDFATLAAQLRKPLSARLMLVPGEGPGDPTGFDYTYFTSSRVLPVPQHGAARLFRRGGS